ncbi:hypothetical protein K435DRAFT_799111 [Dendrothele bispora CBS 962.96]|uniref:Uncharacterized protein n=1 Tax=Dendrothele bispora (strain CBS 962.96) TaxID=1314807 RepID=A0A4S8LWY1_DENBC|nr:hypothetical protein K435DRAFT_799111 [Dendrothele bispora CBS 962.96]
MSTYDYEPGNHDSVVFEQRRRPGGLYDYITNLVSQKMGKSAFANTVPGTDFVRATRPGTRTYGFMEKDGRPFNCNVFGEILGPKHGTLMTARYNHFPGDDRFNPMPLTDSSKPAKAVIALGCPTLATDALYGLWYNQLCAAVDLRASDKKWEEETGGNQKLIVKEFVKNRMQPASSDAVPDTLLLTGPAMYTVPPQGSTDSANGNADATTSPQPSRNRMKRRRIDADTSTSSPSIGSSSVNQMATTTNSSLSAYPTGDQIFVGATYDPCLQFDYGGPSFNQTHAQLVQPDFRDVTQKLICPWEFYDKLRPGTLILANIDIVVYPVPTRKFAFKVYHANILSLRVLAESDVPVQRPEPYQVPKAVASETEPVPATTDDHDTNDVSIHQEDSPELLDLPTVYLQECNSSSLSETLADISTINPKDLEGYPNPSEEVDVAMEILELEDKGSRVDDDQFSISRGKGKRASKGKKN